MPRRPAWCSCRTPATARRPSRARSASCPPAPPARSPRPSPCRSRIPALGPIVNVASVSATTPDDTAANNTATVETTLNRNADVAISKSVSPAVGARGPADHLHRGGDQSRARPRHRPRRPGPAPGRPVVRVGVPLAGELRGRHRRVDDRDAAERAVGDADARGDRDRGRRHHQPRAGRRAGPARPRGEQQLGRGDRERRRQRRRRRDQDRRQAGAVGGRRP